MQQSLSVLDNIRIASPCTVPWASMQGDERVRHCSQCNLNVYNLSAMNRVEAEALVRQREGRHCIGFYRRMDGTILTADCPLGVRNRRRRFRAFIKAAAVVTLAIMYVPSFFGIRRVSERRISQIRPVVSACRAIESKIRPIVTPTQRGKLTNLGYLLGSP